MTHSQTKWLIVLVLLAFIILIPRARTQRDATVPQTNKPVFINRLFTGPDGQTHAEKIDVKFTAGSPTDVAKLMAITGAELHRAPAGSVNSWHRAPRRQYVITLSGHGEIELAGGKKIAEGPGDIELAEDTTGQGHITRVVGNEDRVTLQIPLVDQSGK